MSFNAFYAQIWFDDIPALALLTGAIPIWGVLQCLELRRIYSDVPTTQIPFSIGTSKNRGSDFLERRLSANESSHQKNSAPQPITKYRQTSPYRKTSPQSLDPLNIRNDPDFKMADPPSKASLLTTLTNSLLSAQTSLPNSSSLTPPKEGLSLLDTKSELLLSYLQTLVFLLLSRFRQQQSPSPSLSDPSDDSILKTLVHLRLLLEKGVRPLEARLKYQVDKVLLAAAEADRSTTLQSTQTTKPHSQKPHQRGSDSEASASPPPPPSTVATKADELLYVSKLASQKLQPAQLSGLHEPNNNTTGVYRPPRVQATSLPTPQDQRKAQRSRTLDEFVTAEFSTGPVAEPSVGTRIEKGGRVGKSERGRREERERTDYEEGNFVRLPEVKKGRRDRDVVGYGGEEWGFGGLGRGADRIGRLTGGGGKKGGKRRMESEGKGVGIGERVEKRRRVLEGGKRKGR
ncbi:MAG: hypothetical protein M1814_002193 [Vezdaea aestivalis]|nr:MAG: hypothetical protein M1814_002193 [Vezdaea aestivalis]